MHFVCLRIVLTDVKARGVQLHDTKMSFRHQLYTIYLYVSSWLEYAKINIRVWHVSSLVHNYVWESVFRSPTLLLESDIRGMTLPPALCPWGVQRGAEHGRHRLTFHWKAQWSHIIPWHFPSDTSLTAVRLIRGAVCGRATACCALSHPTPQCS